jgi:hypothetical protein
MLSSDTTDGLMCASKAVYVCVACTPSWPHPIPLLGVLGTCWLSPVPVGCQQCTVALALHDLISLAHIRSHLSQVA